MKNRSTVRDGQVQCPTRGLVDADECTECGRAVSIRRDASQHAVVVCRPEEREKDWRDVGSFQL